MLDPRSFDTSEEAYWLMQASRRNERKKKAKTRASKARIIKT